MTIREKNGILLTVIFLSTKGAFNCLVQMSRV